jgi:hypothetical protein
MASPPDLIIRPILLQDAEALWMIARQEGVLETKAWASSSKDAAR